MATVSFDTPQFVKRLEEAGLQDAQAEAISDAVRDSQTTTIERPATIRVGAMMGAAILLVAALVKLL